MKTAVLLEANWPKHNLEWKLHPWVCLGVFHFELLSVSVKNNTDIYCQQLEHLNIALKKQNQFNQ